MSKWYYCVKCDERVHISVLQANEGLCEACAEKQRKFERQVEQEIENADNRD